MVGRYNGRLATILAIGLNLLPGAIGARAAENIQSGTAVENPAIGGGAGSSVFFYEITCLVNNDDETAELGEALAFALDQTLAGKEENIRSRGIVQGQCIRNIEDNNNNTHRPSGDIPLINQYISM